MKDLLYLKDDQIKEFIQLLYNAHRETSADPKEILSKNKPNNIEEAKQLPGMTPAAASILLRYVKK